MIILAIWASLQFTICYILPSLKTIVLAASNNLQSAYFLKNFRISQKSYKQVKQKLIYHYPILQQGNRRTEKFKLFTQGQRATMNQNLLLQPRALFIRSCRSILSHFNDRPERKQSRFCTPASLRFFQTGKKISS